MKQISDCLYSRGKYRGVLNWEMNKRGAMIKFILKLRLFFRSFCCYGYGSGEEWQREKRRHITSLYSRTENIQRRERRNIKLQNCKLHHIKKNNCNVVRVEIPHNILYMFFTAKKRDLDCSAGTSHCLSLLLYFLNIYGAAMETSPRLPRPFIGPLYQPLDDT